MIEGEKHPCPNCNNGVMTVFHRASAVPTNSCILLESREAALQYPRGDIALGFCPACSFISNTSFEQRLTEYSGRYEETQGFSETFNKFHRHLAKDLIEKYDLNEKTVLEIGCGKGEFLMLLAELGNNRGLGFDPGYKQERNTSEAADRVKFIVDFYSEKYADYKADFICCKMTLEHISPTGDFIRMVRATIGNSLDTIVFFQVPDAVRIIEQCAFEDIYYEHCSYFCPSSLVNLFSANGFEVLSVENQYDGQYLTIEAKPSLVPKTIDGAMAALNFEAIEQSISSFPQRFEERSRYWKDQLANFRESGSRVVIWGSGSKGVAFLTTLGVTDEIEYAVDINPYRHGYFMPGNGQEIVPPDFLIDYRPDCVIVMNSIYSSEICAHLRSIGLKPKILSI